MCVHDHLVPRGSVAVSVILADTHVQVTECLHVHSDLAEVPLEVVNGRNLIGNVARMIGHGHHLGGRASSVERHLWQWHRGSLVRVGNGGLEGDRRL
jgi:hypothetical protein